MIYVTTTYLKVSRKTKYPQETKERLELYSSEKIKNVPSGKRVNIKESQINDNIQNSSSGPSNAPHAIFQYTIHKTMHRYNPPESLTTNGLKQVFNRKNKLF